MCALVADYFSDGKKKRKSDADLASQALQKAMAKKSEQSDFSYIKEHQIAFEKAYLNIGTATIDQLIGNLRTTVLEAYRKKFWPFLWGKSQPSVASIGELTYVPTGTNSWNVRVQARVAADTPVASVIIGTIYRGNGRFELLVPQPKDVVNTVYIKRTQPHQHYIGYQRDGVERFIRRYVARGLNQDDSRQLAEQKALKASAAGIQATSNEIQSEDATGKHGVDVGTTLTLDQQILSHTRGWYKRFISTTTTSRAVYSTLGEEFRSVFGKVIVDLAFVPGADIYDIHTPEALHHFNTTGDALINPASSAYAKASERKLADEQHLAARDVIRTREVLIRGQVPFAAIRYKSMGKRIVAISHPGVEQNGSTTFNAVEGAWKLASLGGWQGEETLSYRRDNLWFKFYLFSDAAQATLRLDAVPEAYKEFKSTRGFFDFPDVLPVGFAR
jgi:hypothetical protein